MDMNALWQMLANGWPLALFGFFLGIVTGGLMSRAKNEGEAAEALGDLTDGDPAHDALVAEMRAVKDLIDAGDADSAAVADQLKSLDEAVKRANGRLKLITKAVKRAK